MRKRSSSVAELEDVTGIVGWMYTDLFVGLMVIFLATISFIPEGTRFVDPRAVQTYSKIFPTPLANRYISYDFVKIKKNIDEFAAKNGFDGSEAVARLQIVTSYNPSSSSQSEAIQRAIAIGNQLKSDSPELFGHSVTLIKQIEDTNNNEFVLELTFNTFVQVLAADQKG